jgi:hypothetical protein
MWRMGQIAREEGEEEDETCGEVLVGLLCRERGQGEGEKAYTSKMVKLRQRCPRREDHDRETFS